MRASVGFPSPAQKTRPNLCGRGKDRCIGVLTDGRSCGVEEKFLFTLIIIALRETSGFSYFQYLLNRRRIIVLVRSGEKTSRFMTNVFSNVFQLTIPSASMGETMDVRYGRKKTWNRLRNGKCTAVHYVQLVFIEDDEGATMPNRVEGGTWSRGKEECRRNETEANFASPGEERMRERGKGDRGGGGGAKAMKTKVGEWRRIGGRGGRGSVIKKRERHWLLVLLLSSTSLNSFLIFLICLV